MFSRHIFISFLILLLNPHTPQTKAVLDKRALCTASLNGPVDLNALFNIPSNSYGRFAQAFTLRRLRGRYNNHVIQWEVPIRIRTNATEDTYQIVLNQASIQDTILSYSFFKSQWTIELNPHLYDIKSVCGVPKDSDPIMFAQRDTLFDNEICVPFLRDALWSNKTIIKVEFVQGYDKRYRLLEYYSSFLIRTALNSTQIYSLTRIKFSLGGSIDMRDVRVPKLWANLMTCPVLGNDTLYNNLLEENALANIYNERPLYTLITKLCYMVDEPEVFDLITEYSRDYDKYLGINVSRVNSSNIYADFVGAFDFQLAYLAQMISIYPLNLNNLPNSPAFNHFDILELKKFWVNMTIVDGQCSILMQNFVLGNFESQAITSFEMFSLMQDLDGITLRITSRGYPFTLLHLPKLYLVRVRCTTVKEERSLYLETSPNPYIKIRRKILECQ